MLIAIIIFCEIGFWVLLGAGLLVRYRWKLRRLSTILLVSVPLLDIVLLVASVVDLRSGSEASLRHGLAVAYIAYSVMFGHRTMKWADQKYAHRFAGGPPPINPPAGGWPRVRHETMAWVQILVAYAIAWAVTGLLIVSVGDSAATTPLVQFTAALSRIVLIAAIWPISWLVSVLRNPHKYTEPDSTTEEIGPEADTSTPAGDGADHRVAVSKAPRGA